MLKNNSEINVWSKMRLRKGFSCFREVKTRENNLCRKEEQSMQLEVTKKDSDYIIYA